MIPRIIHQTWIDPDVPERFRRAQRSWQEAHPDWEYRFWTDGDLDRLVEERAPELKPLYKRYPENIQRVDAARYLIMREFGGLYADLDVECLKSVEPLAESSLVLPRTTPFGVSGQFMLAEPNHPFFDEAVATLPRAFSKWRLLQPRHLRILTTTGPLFLTGCLRRFGKCDGLRLLSLDEHGHGDPSESYVRHLRGNTWAKWDTHVIVFFHDHWKLLAAGAATASLLAAAIGWAS